MRSVSQHFLILKHTFFLFFISNTIEKSSETKLQEPNLKCQTSPSDQDIQEQQMTTSLKGEGMKFIYGLSLYLFFFSFYQILSKCLLYFSASESDKKTSIQRSNETIPVSTEMAATETKSDDVREQEHDVPYFRFVSICFPSWLSVLGPEHE